ncbi:MAG: N-acetylglucosamine-6-phosphate deacetylase [Spirochaetota bacterium]
MTLRGRWVETGNGLNIEIDDAGIVSGVSPYSAQDNEPYLAPGFFDIQVNGYRGSDYSSESLSGEEVLQIRDYLSMTGTTRHIPTIISNSQNRILRNLKVLKDAVSRYPNLAYSIPAVHLEGPYVSGEDGPRGAHDRSFVREPSIEEYVQWKEASGGLLKMVTIAPERKGAMEFIRHLTKDGTLVAIGHTGADPATIRQAVSNGARLSTHLGNGSHAVIPRLKNYIWEQLAADELSAGLIADGFHLPPSVLKVFYRAKGPENTILVSDVGPMGGQEPGEYKWGAINVEVHPDGHLGLAGTDFLAGAGHLLDRGIAQFVNATGCSLAAAIKLCTLNPAKLLALPGTPEGRELPFPQRGEMANLIRFSFSFGDSRITLHDTVLGNQIKEINSV